MTGQDWLGHASYDISTAESLLPPGKKDRFADRLKELTGKWAVLGVKGLPLRVLKTQAQGPI